MFYLTAEEVKRLNGVVLPAARTTGVSEQLRGWTWSESPLFTAAKAGLPMYMVCSRYCSTGRDVYVSRVLNKRPEPGYKVKLGAAVHEVVRQAYLGFIEFRGEGFDDCYRRLLSDRGIASTVSSIREACEGIWFSIQAECKGRYESLKAERPYASNRDLISSAAPFMVDHSVPGRLLGLSGVVRLDCYDYLRKIVFDLKVEASHREWYRLYPTGYAMVLESVYETPVDVGCVVYLNIGRGRLSVQRDLFFIDDELRSWWLEERDEKSRMVDGRRDPGVAPDCDPECMYRSICSRS